MNHGSCFTGIGGFDLAAEWMGWNNVLHCEIDDWARRLLKQKWPKAESYGGITEVDFTKYRGIIDILTGGWPCQDNSRANRVNGGGQQGLSGKRSGLLYQFTRAIREIRPFYAVGENSPDVLTIHGGRDFNAILSELAAMGYNATWGLLRTSDIGAPHHRERLYILAYTGSIGSQTMRSIWSDARKEIERTSYTGLFDGTAISIGGAWREIGPDILRMDDGVPDRLHRLKGLGNAVSPHVPFQIFKAIEKMRCL